MSDDILRHGSTTCRRNETGQKRRLKPATVLIGSFQTRIGEAIVGRLLTVDRTPGRPAIKPNIEGVGTFGEIVPTRQFRGRRSPPIIHPVRVQQVDSLGEMFRHRDPLRIMEDGDRNAPTSLTGDTPL